MEKNQFENFGLSDEIKKAISALGYKSPTEVQRQVIPVALEGRDIIVKSETGSGKTAAFAIPVCESIKIEEKGLAALVLTPTRELALQVKEDITNLGRFKRIRCSAIFGKQPINTQINELKQRVHVVVGTPGRIQDHINRGSISLDNIKYLILDEADRMLSMGFIEQVEHIMMSVPQDRITMLFSATLTDALKGLCSKYMNKPQSIEINPDKLIVEKIVQTYYEVEEYKKFDLLNRILFIEKPNSCMIFCRTKERTGSLASKIKLKGYPCRELHGGMLQNERLDTIKEFRKGEFRFLVATDIASRGIDIENITHIINYDVPMEKEAYVHRIGRTARAGSGGKAVTFVTPYENKFLKDIEEYIGMKISRNEIPSWQEAEKHKDKFLSMIKIRPDVKPEKESKLNKKIGKLYIGGGKNKKIRPGDIVGAISTVEGVDAEDIGIIDIQDNVSYVDILNGKDSLVLKALQDMKIKGKSMRVEKADK